MVRTLEDSEGVHLRRHSCTGNTAELDAGGDVGDIISRATLLCCAAAFALLPKLVLLRHEEQLGAHTAAYCVLLEPETKAIRSRRWCGDRWKCDNQLQ